MERVDVQLLKLMSNQAEIISIAGILRDVSRNLEPEVNVYKNSFAPIVCNGDLTFRAFSAGSALPVA